MNISILISSLSTQNSSARMRIWRSIKSCGAATLRDGVYVLPNEQKQRFDPIIDEHQSADGIAYLFDSVSNNNLDLISYSGNLIYCLLIYVRIIPFNH